MATQKINYSDLDKNVKVENIQKLEDSVISKIIRRNSLAYFYIKFAIINPLKKVYVGKNLGLVDTLLLLLNLKKSKHC
jgi:hypothetical protein